MSDKKTIIGIDQSLTGTGVSVICDNVLVHCEMIHTTNANTIFERIDIIQKQVMKICDQYKPDHIAIEEIPRRNMKGMGKELAGLYYVLCSRLSEQYDVTPITIQEAKTIATGKGKAEKSEMFAALPDIARDFILSVEKRKTKGLYDLTDSYWMSQVRIKQLNL